MILMTLVLAVLVSMAFAAVFTRPMLPTYAVTWDRRVLTPSQVYNRESLRRVMYWLAGLRGRLPLIRRSTLRALKRFAMAAGLGFSAFSAGYLAAMILHGIVLLVLLAVRR